MDRRLSERYEVVKGKLLDVLDFVSVPYVVDKLCRCVLDDGTPVSESRLLSG